MQKEKDEQFKDLLNLLGSGALEDIELQIDKFNIFTTLKLDNTEIRHSNFLAWLLDPLGSHLMTDYFFKEFLKNAINDFVCDDRIEVKPKDIFEQKFWNAEIRREYKNIDILVINHDYNFLCVIENKVWSGEHSQQLEKYAECIEKEFKNYKKLHIFLTPTPNPDEPVLTRGCADYIQMDYEQIIEVINKVLKYKSNIMADDVKIFIEHYKKMVERNIMKKIDEKVKEICRETYKLHRDAIDLIFECKNNAAKDITTILQEIVKENPELILDKSSNETWTKFYPKSIDGNDLYLQFCTDNEARLELVIMTKKETEGLMNFLIEELNLDKSFNTNSKQGFSIKLLATLVSKQNYYNLICLPKETLKEQLQIQLNKSGVINELVTILNKSKSTSTVS